MYHQRIFKGLGLFFLLACMVPSTFLWAQSNGQDAPDPQEQQALNNLAQELVVLRSQIESINAELTDLTDQHRASMNALAAQKGELEASMRRERLRVEELEKDLANFQQRAQQAGLATQALIPVAKDAIASLRAHIETGFPFKRMERMAVIDNVEDQLLSEALSPARVVNRLWSFYEDELRLARENGLYSQTIELSGERVLADVAKIGVVAMYFVTRDGRMGYATYDDPTWRFVEAQGGGERQQIAALIDAMQKQIRVGLFELPNGSIQLGEGA